MMKFNSRLFNSRLLDPDTIEERLQIIVDGYKRFTSYSTLYHELKEQAINEEKLSTSISKQLSEKAIDAERSVRIVLKESLDMLNEWVDSGAMEATLEEAVQVFESQNVAKGQGKGIELVKHVLKERYPELDLGFLDEGLQFVRQHEARVTVEEGKLRVSIKGSDKQEHTSFIDPHPKPGQLGRIGSHEFFCRDGSKGAMLTKLTRGETNQPTQLDVYGSLVRGFTFTKQAMYRHVRLVNELGLSRFSGEDPISIVVGIVFGVVITIIVTGLIIGIGCNADWWSGDVCTSGLWILWFIGLGALTGLFVESTIAGILTDYYLDPLDVRG